MVVPTGKVAGASEATVAPKISVAVAVPIATEVWGPVASVVTLAGTVRAGTVVSATVTVCVPVVVRPFPSVAVYVTVVVPSGKVAGALLVTVAPKISVAVAVPIATVLLTALASTLTLPGTVRAGAVVSATVTL